MLSYWAKLRYDDTPRLSKHILSLIASKNGAAIPNPNVNVPYKFPWLDTIQGTLNEVGLSSAFNSADPLDPKYLNSVYAMRRSSIGDLPWKTCVYLKQ